MSTPETTEKKEKTRLFDETGKRLLKEIWPLRGWIALLAVFCLLLIGSAVAVPELLGAQIDKLYDWALARTPGLARGLLPGLGALLGIYALRSGLTYEK